MDLERSKIAQVGPICSGLQSSNNRIKILKQQMFFQRMRYSSSLFDKILLRSVWSESLYYIGFINTFKPVHFPLSSAVGHPRQHRQLFPMKRISNWTRGRAAGSGSKFANHWAMLLLRGQLILSGKIFKFASLETHIALFLHSYRKSNFTPCSCRPQGIIFKYL